jgi:hypothetical protein
MYGPFGNKEAAQVAQSRNTAAFTPLTITEWRGVKFFFIF